MRFKHPRPAGAPFIHAATRASAERGRERGTRARVIYMRAVSSGATARAFARGASERRLTNEKMSKSGRLTATTVRVDAFALDEFGRGRARERHRGSTTSTGRSRDDLLECMKTRAGRGDDARGRRGTEARAEGGSASAPLLGLLTTPTMRGVRWSSKRALRGMFDAL